MKTKKPLLVTLNNYPESCNLCRIGLAYTYVDANKYLIRDNFFICAVKNGRLKHCVGDAAVELRRGDMFIVPPKVIATEEYLEPDTQFYIMEFSKEFLQYDPFGETIKDRLLTFLLMDAALEKKESVIAKVPLSADDQFFLFRQIERFHYEFNRRREGMFEILNSILMTIINIFGWRYLYQSKIPRVEQKYHRINKMMLDSVDYIHNHYKERLRLEDITFRFGTSRTNYCTLFKQIIGMTFHAYLNDLRCEKAAQLLLGHEMSLEEVAEATGFNDGSCLYRNFMKHYGVSPGRYRKEHMKEEK
ncbi:MAG: helix-turn-helix transcriptional regulator [Lachnospiraceae bacterium]|jgi:YesN/AraC family two-component response regulator|nr:helix-turn-helix transcriptional regulator [Lachnospiraceae bacterium]